VVGLKQSLERVDSSAAVVVAGAGGLAFGLGLGFRSKVLRMFGLLVAVSGGALYARAKWAERAEKIDVAESDIRATLDDLDPIARAQILKDIVVDP
jgi:uncharacterized membrane protein